MRLALSAVAAVSGLLLLGLAFYGQPAVYLHQAREQWNALLDRPPADPAADPDQDAARERAAQLQREVSRLEEELAARRALEASNDRPPPVDPVPPLASAPANPPALEMRPSATTGSVTPALPAAQPKLPPALAAQPPA